MEEDYKYIHKFLDNLEFEMNMGKELDLVDYSAFGFLLGLPLGGN